jgi:predicted GTPase
VTSEAFTHEKYTSALTGWYARNHGLVRCLVLVLQADSKAYAEDEHLLTGLRSLADKPVVLVLNQVDTLPPVDDAITALSWRSGFPPGSAKGASIREKISLTASQFNHPVDDVVPLIARAGNDFNRCEVIERIETKLAQS